MAIGDPYVTRADFKSVLEITATDEDGWIDRCLAGAARSIERRTGWPTFWNTGTAIQRSVPVAGNILPVRSGGYSYYKLLLPDGIASATGFLVDGISSPELMPEMALDQGRPADAIRLPYGASFSSAGTASITAVWGWPEVAEDIAWANQMQAHRFYRRKGSPEGIAGSAEWGLSRVPRLDPDVLGILKDGGYMRPGIA